MGWLKNHKLWLLVPACILVMLMLWDKSPKSGVVDGFSANRAQFERAARQVLEQGDSHGVTCPEGVTSIQLHLESYPQIPTVEFLFGSSGLGSESRYWGIHYVESDKVVGFQGTRTEYWRAEGNGTLFYEIESDNTCYVERLAEGWYYFEVDF